MVSSSPITGGPSQGFGRDSVASAKNHRISHGAAMGYSSMHPASSRNADRSVGAGAHRPAVATITPAPPVNGVAGERVACRGVKGGGPRRIGRARLARLIGRIFIAGLGTVLPRLGSIWPAAILEFARTAAGLGVNGGQALTSASTLTEIARDQFGPVIWISRETGRDARINHRLLRRPLAPPRILTGCRDTWPPERRQCGDSFRTACGFAQYLYVPPRLN